MLGSSALSVLFTVVFLVTGGHSFVRLVGLVSGPDAREDRASELFHLVMSLGMIAMTWAWSGGPDSPSGALQVVVFGLFTLAFLARLLGRVHGHGRLVDGQHLVMAAAMTWMVAAMPLMMSMPSDGGAGGHAGHAGHAGHGAASEATDMAGMAGMSDPTAEPSPWVVTVSVAFVALLIVSAVVWAARTARGDDGHAPVPPTAQPDGAVLVAPAPVRRTTGPRVAASCHVLMCLGMAGMLLAML